MNKAIGTALLLIGLALIGYGFNAPASHAFTAEKALWLLLGGSASVVLGEAMIFHRSN